MSLLPCPHCGSVDLRERWGQIYCVGCGSEGPDAIDGGSPETQWNRRASGWIKCSDRLPEEGKLVLIFSDAVDSGWLDDGRYAKRPKPSWKAGLRSLKFDAVSRWQPMPQTPTE